MSSVWSFVSVGGNGAAQSGNITLSLPTGHTTGDTLLCLCVSKVKTITVPVPSGYTSIYTKSTWFNLLAKIDSGSETAPVIASGGNNMMASLCAFRGGPGVIPTVANSATMSNSITSSGSISTPSLTPTVDNGLVLDMGSCNDDFGTFTSDPSGFSSVDHNAFHAGGLSLVWAYQIQGVRANLASDGFAISGVGASVSADGHCIVIDSGVLLASKPTRSLLGVGR